MDTDRSKLILLEALKHEQTQCLRFIAEAKRNLQIKEGMMIHWAMREAITVYRELRDGEIEYPAALTRYCEIAKITTDYDTAAYLALFYVPYQPTTAAQIALRNELLEIVNPRKDAA